MGITIDSNGNAHQPRGTAGAGQFTSHVRSAPQSGLAPEREPEFDHDEWSARMTAILDEGEQPQHEQAESVDLFDRATWGATPF